MNKERIRILDKTFEISLPNEKIQQAVGMVAQQINADYADRNPVFVVVLNGAFMFASDLLRQIDMPHDIAFTKLKSYEGTSSTGTITEQMPIDFDIKGRHIIIVEDIVETGFSMGYLQARLAEQQPASIEICALSFKPQKLVVPEVKVKYVGMQLPDAFIVGYGLDYNQQGRALHDIYSLVQ